MIENVPGPVLELGLGNGRTFDHLRQLLPNRAIYVFDREVAAHPECIPDSDHLFLGDFRETLPRAAATLPPAALIHADFGSGDLSATRDVADFVAGAAETLLARAGVIASDQVLTSRLLMPSPVPDSVPQGRYFIYVKG